MIDKKKKRRYNLRITLKGEKNMNRQTDINEFLLAIREEYVLQPKKANSLEELILETLIGTQGTIRNGELPTAETRNEVLSRIKYKVEKNKPLIVTSSWGAIKTVPVDNKNADLAEWLAFEQFHAIFLAIKRIYEPGIEFHIFVGDAFYEYLYGKTKEIAGYYNSLLKLGEKYSEIKIRKLSDQIPNDGMDIYQSEKYYLLLKDYWNETRNLKVEEYGKTETSKRLKDEGWKGELTPPMREFQINRMKKLYPEENLQFWEEKILRFYAYGLVVRLNDYMERKDQETSTVDACLLRIPPIDMPRKLYSNRMRFRITPEKVMKKSAPPWTVVVAIKRNGEKLRLEMYNAEECRSNSFDIVETPEVIVHHLA